MENSTTTEQQVENSTTTEQQVENSTTTAALSAEDPAESAFRSELEQRFGSAEDEWISSWLELARTVCAVLDDPPVAEDEALDRIFAPAAEGAQQAEAALILTIGVAHLCPQHTETLTSYVASRGIELPA